MMKRILLKFSLIIFITSQFYTNARSQCDGNVLNNLTGGNSQHTSSISSSWSKHEWDITFPSQYWGMTLKDVKLWYRLVLTGSVSVNGGFTTGDNGSPVVTFVNANTVNATPPNTSQNDYYLFFDFTGQNLTIPSNGVLWFRFLWTSGYNGREDIGGSAYTSTYQQNDITRPGYASFAIYADLGFSTSQTVLNALCYGDSSGTATVSVSGGYSPYTFQWDSSANNQTDSTATGLAAGVYLVTITDSLGCQDIDTITVDEPPAIVSSTSFTNNLCYGDSSGIASVQATGGAPGYTFLWSDPYNQTDTTATGLLAGIYYVTITDSNGCTKIDSVLLSDPPALTLAVSSTDDVEQSCVGTATALPGGGTPPYGYQWDANTGNQTLQVAISLCEGVYFVSVTDANGCLVSDSAVIGNVSGISRQGAETEILIYPNPNSGTFGIDLAGFEGGGELIMYNSAGAEAARKTFRGETHLSFEHFGPGLYYLRFFIDERVISKSMMIH